MVLSSSYKKGKLSMESGKLRFQNNGIYAIKGDNGCGKTTLIEYLLFETEEKDW